MTAFVSASSAKWRRAQRTIPGHKMVQKRLIMVSLSPHLKSNLQHEQAWRGRACTSTQAECGWSIQILHIQNHEIKEEREMPLKFPLEHSCLIPKKFPGLVHLVELFLELVRAWLVWCECSRVVAGVMASSIHSPSRCGVKDWSARRNLWWC